MAWGSGRKPYSGNRSGNNQSSSKSSGGTRSNFSRGGSGGRGKQQQQQERQWEAITGLFPGRSGHSVFVTDEILEKLQAIKIGDMLFVGARKDSDMLNFSVMLGEDSEQGGDANNKG